MLVTGGFGSGQPTRPLVKELAPVSGLQDEDDARSLIEYGVIPRNFDQGDVVGIRSQSLSVVDRFTIDHKV